MKKTIAFVIFCWTMCWGIPFASIAQSNKTHTVATGETMFAISRLYQIHISELIKANPQIQDNAIKPGDVINIPATATNTVPAQIPVKTAPATSNPQNVTQTNPFGGATGTVNPQPSIPSAPAAQQQTTVNAIKNNQFAMIEHVVQEKQTLYAISKLYNVSIEDIKAWNHLADNSIKVGSTILIRSQKAGESLAVSTTEPVQKTVVSETPPVVKTSSEEQPAIVKAPAPAIPSVKPTAEVSKPATVPSSSGSGGLQGQLEDGYVSAKNSGKTLQSSRGTITWIATENPKMTESFFALHKTAPVGTVVRVTNLVNKRVVFVKVIGKLPETSDNINIVLRLSSAAKNALLLNGDKAYVDMEFYQ